MRFQSVHLVLPRPGRSWSALAGVAAALVVGCGSAGAGLSVTPAEAAATQSPAPVVEPTQAPATPAPTADPGGRSPASGAVTFIHDGFRTDVEQTLALQPFDPYSPGESARVTVALRNLSTASGGIETRATINFGGPFANMLVLRTPDGVRLLHLNRDGSLRPEADDGRFT